MRIISFGDVTLPQQNGAQMLPVSFRSAVIPLRGGGYDQDGANSYPESKMVSAQFWITPDDGTVDDIIDNLYAEAALGRRFLKVTMRDGSTQRQQYAKLISAQTKPSTRVYSEDTMASQGYETMQCQWEMVYPYWEASADFHLLLDDGHTLDEGKTLDEGNYSTATISTTSTSKTIANSGNTKFSKFTLSITGGSGVTIGNITIENTTTGETLLWTGTLTEGDILAIDALTQTIKFNGSNAWNDVTLGANQIGFFTLNVGDNDFEIRLSNISGGTATARWDWHKHYIR